MSNTCFSPCLFSIPNVSLENASFFIPSLLDSPIITSFSPSIAFKISQNPQNPYSAVTEVLSKNGTPLQIKPIYHTIFIREFASICQSKLAQLSQNFTNDQNFSQNSTEIIQYGVQRNEFCLQTNFYFQNNVMKIEFYQIQSTIELIDLFWEDLLRKILIFLKEINMPTTSLFERAGTLKPSFSEKLKNNLKIQKQKKMLKRIIKEQKMDLIQSTVEEMSSETQQISRGVFECLNVIRQEEMNEDELVFKRGGYFNIQKKKLIVSKSTDDKKDAECKTFAQKRLSKRKRPNTIYNYEGKIPRELKLLECLNKASFQQLSHFAKYYILDQTTRIDFKMQSMIDQRDDLSKDTLSTVSQQRPLGQNTNDVIYMDFYDENLQEYLIRKTKLDAFEIISILKQILQSVLVLHKVGIVHRDIKPANFMVQTQKDGSVKTKLIDFGESTHVTYNYESSEILGFSTQYAPIECTYSCKEGFNSKKIDLWSVGVVVYKLTANRMPVTYSKCFKNDIRYQWPTSLNFFVSQHGKGRWSIIESMLLVLSLQLMKVNPNERLDLEKGLKILDRIEKLINQFAKQ